MPLFTVSSTHLHGVFEVFLTWVLATLEFPLVHWLRGRNWEALHAVADLFAEKSNGIFCGVVGALDGLAVRVRSPWPSEVVDPGNFHCRKGFCALNVQACWDRNKRFIWCCPSNKGSTRDSAAFAGSGLCDPLVELSGELKERGPFIVGDSACSLTPFLLAPHDINSMKSDPENAKDGFNYHLSSCRIHMECAFGELAMRWGSFWRTLLFDLKKGATVIQVVMLPHNCTVDNRNGTAEDNSHFSGFQIGNDEIQQAITCETGELPRALVTDNNEPGRPGRRTLEEEELRSMGALMRDQLMVKLSSNQMRRPLGNDMRHNSSGNIHMI